MTEPTGTPAPAVADFAQQFTQFINDMREKAMISTDGRSALGQIVTDHLGTEAAQLEPVQWSLSATRDADLDIALHDLAEETGGRWIGIASHNREHFDTLMELFSTRMGPVEPGPVTFTRAATGPDTTRRLVNLGLLLTTLASGPVAILVRGQNLRYGRDQITLEFLGPDLDAVTSLQEDLERRMTERSVLRGQIVSFRGDAYGQSGAGVTFLARPDVAAEQVILPAGQRERVTRHVVEMGRHAGDLKAANQHLKRGVLLYGPPGTGKTHLIRHLLSVTPDTTAILLTGRTLHLLGQAADLARAMQPAIIVMEDCDLVAEMRGGDTNAALFETLEAMDGLSGDADIAFILTTNRPDLLETALVERPGRVDLAVAVDRPDHDARRSLFALYAADLMARGQISPAAVDRAAAATEGVTASFTREVIRRCVIAAAMADRDVTDEDVDRELAGLLSDGEEFTRSILGGRPMNGADESSPDWDD